MTATNNITAMKTMKRIATVCDIHIWELESGGFQTTEFKKRGKKRSLRIDSFFASFEEACAYIQKKTGWVGWNVTKGRDYGYRSMGSSCNSIC